MANILQFSAISKDVQRLSGEIDALTIDVAKAKWKTEPWTTDSWEYLPLLDQTAVGSNHLCIYDSATGDLRCGANCSWTVPAGATKVQFQLWGAGGGTGGAYACGGSPLGNTGAYATIIIDAVPGEAYTLCAACAMCCCGYCTQTMNGRAGATYVTGQGLNNLCATSGFSGCISRNMSLLHENACCRYRGAAASSTASGACICASGSFYCYDNSCATCGEIPYVVDPDVTFYGTETGLNGSWPIGCFDTNHYGYFQGQPVIGINNNIQPNSDCKYTFTSGQCCGRAKGGACTGQRCYPGAGGMYAHTMGGNIGYGDYGRGGMVRVSWI